MKKRKRSMRMLFALLLMSGCSPAAKKNSENLHQEIAITTFLRGISHEDGFVIEFCDAPFLPTGETANPPFSYPAIKCLPRFFHSKPGAKYVLYCLDTGCPAQPEYLQKFLCDSQGNLRYDIPKEDVDDLKDLVSKNGGFLKDVFDPVSLVICANPGFLSDWYLQREGSLEIYHTTLVYHPLTAMNRKGQSLTVHKKEWGGNMLEIVFHGFTPHEEITWKEMNGQEEVKHKDRADEKGSLRLFLEPHATKAERGTMVIAAETADHGLHVDANWDKRTLSIKREFSPFVKKMYDLMQHVVVPQPF